MKRSKLTSSLVLAAVVGAVAGGLLSPGSARAADTVETWAAGAGDVEFYMQMDGFGRRAHAQAVGGDLLLGWGVADRLSAYLATAMQADGYFTGGSAELAVGLFGTPLDTDHFDLDLMLDVCAGGDGLGDLCLGPAVELNFDAAPDGAAWGAYARAGLAVAGRGAEALAAAEGEIAQSGASAGPERVVDGLLTCGGYLTLDERSQLLLEYDLKLHERREAGLATTEIGGVALGYNRLLNATLELVSQVRLDVPQDGESAAVGFTLGLIAAVPGVGR